jgi:hypothetical protein
VGREGRISKEQRCCNRMRGKDRGDSERGVKELGDKMNKTDDL